MHCTGRPCSPGPSVWERASAPALPVSAGQVWVTRARPFPTLCVEWKQKRCLGDAYVSLTRAGVGCFDRPMLMATVRQKQRLSTAFQTLLAGAACTSAPGQWMVAPTHAAWVAEMRIPDQTRLQGAPHASGCELLPRHMSRDAFVACALRSSLCFCPGSWTLRYEALGGCYPRVLLLQAFVHKMLFPGGFPP